MLVFVFAMNCKANRSGADVNEQLLTRLKTNLTSTFPPLDMVNKTVQTELIIVQILGVNEKKGTLTLRLYLNYIYLSPSAAWNITEFQGVDRLKIPSGLLWVPDFGECDSFIVTFLHDFTIF